MIIFTNFFFLEKSIQYLNRAKVNPIIISLFSVLLAAVAHSRCSSSLVCSCYVAARNSDSNKEEEIIRTGASRNQVLASNIRDGFLEGRRFCNDKSSRNDQLIKSKYYNGDSSSRSKSNVHDPMPLKSNLKKATVLQEIDQLRLETRKVNWPDALGKDIAHIQEFEPSVSEDGELESVRNSCVCVIQ